MSQFSAHAPAIPTVLIDDATTRVTRWDFEPGAETGWHTHGLAYVVVPMTDLNLLLRETTGERVAFVAKGAAYTRAAGMEHNVINGGTEFMSFIEIEMKR
jgi:quercetin dioxygenase-like cupin family protein